jgi:hypothetical protein
MLFTKEIVPRRLSDYSMCKKFYVEEDVDDFSASVENDAKEDINCPMLEYEVQGAIIRETRKERRDR